MGDSNNQLAIVRYATISKYPYFSSIIFGLIPIPRPPKDGDPMQLKTMAVDKWMRLYYDPEFLDKHPLDELIGVLIHEINHLLRFHHSRMIGGDPIIANYAGDMEINDDIISDKNCGVKLPKFCVFPDKPPYNFPKDKLAEWYYNELMEKADKIPMPKIGCGSCATGKKEDWEEGGPDGTNSDGHSETMIDFFRRATAEQILAESKTRGTIPEYLKRWAENFLQSKVDWKKELRSTILNVINAVAAGMTDYTYQRPSRRQSCSRDIILPGFHSPIPKVGVIVDTSGSVGDKQLSQAVAEIAGILKKARAEVIVVSVDAAVHSIGQVRSPAQIQFQGGGGTDMPEGYKALEKYKVKPNIVICITDGYTPWPEKPIKNTKNIVVLTCKGGEAGIPEWAKVIYAEPDEEGKKKD